MTAPTIKVDQCMTVEAAEQVGRTWLAEQRFGVGDRWVDVTVMFRDALGLPDLFIVVVDRGPLLRRLWKAIWR